MSAGEATPAHDYVLHDHAHGLDFEPLAWHQHAHDGPGHSGVQHTHAHRHVRPGAVPAPVPSRSIALACGHPEGPATLHRDERTAWCPSCEADVGVTHLSEPPPNPYRSAEAIRAHIDRDWQPVLLDLIELEEAGRLDGVRRYVAASLAQVRGQAAPPPLAADGPEVRAYWDGLHADLAELELRDALPGIRAIVAERLARIRAGTPCEQPVAMAAEEIRMMKVTSAPGSPRRMQVLATAAALLAAEIDRQEANRGDDSG